MDGRRYDSMDGGARATQDAVAENNALEQDARK